MASKPVLADELNDPGAGHIAAYGALQVGSERSGRCERMWAWRSGCTARAADGKLRDPSADALRGDAWGMVKEVGLAGA